MDALCIRNMYKFKSRKQLKVNFPFGLDSKADHKEVINNLGILIFVITRANDRFVNSIISPSADIFFPCPFAYKF